MFIVLDFYDSTLKRCTMMMLMKRMNKTILMIMIRARYNNAKNIKLTLLQRYKSAAHTQPHRNTLIQQSDENPPEILANCNAHRAGISKRKIFPPKGKRNGKASGEWWMVKAKAKGELAMRCEKCKEGEQSFRKASKQHENIGRCATMIMTGE